MSAVDIMIAWGGHDAASCDAERCKKVEQQIEQQIVTAFPTTVLRVTREDHRVEGSSFRCQSLGKPLKHLQKGRLTRLCWQPSDDRLAVISLQRRPGKGKVRIRNMQERRST